MNGFLPRVLVLGLVTAVLLSSPPANAESAKEIFERHGLFGTWAADCKKPASIKNPHVVYRSLGADRVQRETLVEPGKIFDVSVPESVVASGVDELVIAWKTGEGGITNRIRLQRDQMQVVDSTRGNGEKLAVNGRGVRDGTENPRFRRCGVEQSRRPAVTLICARTRVRGERS